MVQKLEDGQVMRPDGRIARVIGFVGPPSPAGARLPTAAPGSTRDGPLAAACIYRHVATPSGGADGLSSLSGR